MFVPHPQANARSSQLEGEAASLRSASQSAANRTAALEQENAALLAELAAAREAAATAQAAQAAAERNAQAAARKLESKAAAESKTAQVRSEGGRVCWAAGCKPAAAMQPSFLFAKACALRLAAVLPLVAVLSLHSEHTAFPSPPLPYSVRLSCASR